MGNKTINEELAILRKMLAYAEEIGELRKPPPKIRRLKVQRPGFDFLDFDEARRIEEAVPIPADTLVACGGSLHCVVLGLHLA